MTTVLVTGAAGYIGSHTVRALLDDGADVVALDNLSSGHRAALPDDVPLVEADLADREAVVGTLAEHRPDAVIHFAGSIEAGESMTDPRRFYANNLVNGLHLVDAMVDTEPVPMVFSSSAAVYGEPDGECVAEDDPTVPTNVYGETKLAFERVLAAYDHAYGLRSLSLRYFNACGAHPGGRIGADHRHKTHLITLALLTALGQRPAMEVFGTDYPTPDGTCIRDYIHVDDLASAHVLGVRALLDGASTTAYNVGVGRGFSVTEVLDAVDRVTEGRLERRLCPRREGDPAALVADASRIGSSLGWSATHVDLDRIIASAWEWHRSHPRGFGD
jgi:UDP-glucose 4-epimerase